MSVVRGPDVRSTRPWIVAAVLSLTLAACSDSSEPEPTPGTSAPTATASTASPTTAPTASPIPLTDLVVEPGAIGPAEAGMGRDEALATGLFDADVEGGAEECERTEPLAWKADYAASLDVLTRDDGTIVSLGVRGEEPRTAEGLGVGSTLRQVSRTYETAEMTEAGYGQTGVFVTDGERWLGFLFDADVESIGPKAKVTLVEVTRGTRPSLMRDGC